MSDRKRFSKSTGITSRHVCDQHSPRRKVSTPKKQLNGVQTAVNNVKNKKHVSTKTKKPNSLGKLNSRMAEGGDNLIDDLAAAAFEHDNGNVDNRNTDTSETKTPQRGLTEAELGAAVLDVRNRLLAEEDVMASSTVCTDGSDVEVLTDDKESSDSIEVIDAQQGKKCDQVDSEDQLSSKGGSEAGSSWCSDNFEKTFGDKLVLSDGNSDVAPSPPVPVEASITVHNDSESECLLPTTSGDTGATARMKLDKYAYAGSGSSAPPSGGTSGDDDDEITPVTQGYDLMADLDHLENSGNSRPDSLSLPHKLSRHRQLARSESESSSWSDICSHHSSTEALIEAATNTPLHAQGNLTRDGDMIAFVTEDLTEKIRMSSPLARIDVEGRYLGNGTPSSRSISSLNSMTSSTSGWSTSSASGWSALSNVSGMSRSPSVMTQSPEDIPPIDPRAIHDLEVYARRAADSLDSMMGNLKSALHKMSGLTVNCVDAYKDGIDNTCDSVDAAIKSMYALMAKCEELSKTIRPAYCLADQIKEIKRLLDLFEAQVAKEEKAAALAVPVSTGAPPP